MSGILIVAVVVALGVGAWRLAEWGTFGDDPAPPTNSVAGLVPAGGVATPDGSHTPDATPTAAAMTPIEQLPGIQSVVRRDYGLFDQWSSIPDLWMIGVSIYRFDTESNARASYGLIVNDAIAEFAMTASRNAGYAMDTDDVPNVGERGTVVRLDSPHSDDRYQVQENLLTLDGTYIFAVMTVTGGPLTGEETPASVDEASAAAIDLATALVDSGEPSPDDARFYADGTSTGGDWGFMPAHGDPLLVGLRPLSDQQLYPAENEVDAMPVSFPPDAPDLTGIVAVVYREYVTEDLFVGSQSVSIADATPMTEAELATERYTSIGLFVYQLETPKDAAVAYDRLSKGLLGSLTGLYQGDSPTRLVSEDLSGVGDQATRSRLTMTATSGGWTNQTTFQYITVQRGEYVFVVSTHSMLGPVEVLPDLGDRPDLILDLAVQFAGSQPSPDEPVHADAGASTGGLWGFMPALDDPLLMGLIPWTDQVLYPKPPDAAT